MPYVIEISRQDIDPYTESGEWMDGDRRVLQDYPTETETYDADEAEFYGTPEEWAAERISRTDAYEPSSSPVGTELPAHAWLSGSYEDPYTTKITETSVRLTGDWTDRERAEIFRNVYKSATGRSA